MDCTITAMLHYAGNPHNATEQHAQSTYGKPVYTFLYSQQTRGSYLPLPLVYCSAVPRALRSAKKLRQLPTDGAERALDYSSIMRYNSGTRTPRNRYHIIGKTGKKPTKYKEITPNTTFVKFHWTLYFLPNRHLHRC